MTQTLAHPIVHKHSDFDRLSMSVVLRCTALGLAFVAGLAFIAVAYFGSRRGSETSMFFWPGLLLLFVPFALAALREHAHRRERLAMVIFLGVALYLVKVFGSPDAFIFSDEFIHLRNTQDILRTGDLFAPNPLLPTAVYYPGLAGATAGLVELTSLSPFAAGVLVIAAARVLFSACFFLVAEKVLGSSRGAAVASLIYAANPMFLFWSAAFSYENLALPLAVFVVWWLAHTRHSTNRPAHAVTIIAIIAVSVTHHVAGFALAALLCACWLAEGYTQRPPSTAGYAARKARRHVGLMAIVAGAATLAWFFFVARPAASYLFTGNISPAMRQTGSLLLGDTAPRKLYNSGGYAAPVWEPVAGAVALGVLLLALPPALYHAWRHRNRAPMVVAMAVAVVFPLSLVPRLAPDGVAISGRSSEYIFVGLACVVGLLAEQVTWRRRSQEGQAAARAVLGKCCRTPVVAGLITLVFVGEVTIGTAFYQRAPEASHPKGYPWSVQSDVITASKWAREHLGIHQRFGANAIDAFALATYGEQNTVKEDDVWPIFFAPKMNQTVVHGIRANRVRYLLVDSRMTRGVPPTPGYYFSPQEPHAGQYTQSFPVAALKKFAASTCAQLLYNADEVKIYDVSRIENGSCVPPPARVAPEKKAVPR
jgi:hypothetical protein